MSTPEGYIKNAILEWFSLQKNCFVFPVDSVGIFDPSRGIYRKRQSRFHRKGVADIIGIWDGIPLAVEVKSLTGRLRPEQKIFLDDFKGHGGIAIVARSVNDVINGIRAMGGMIDEARRVRRLGGDHS